MKTKILKTVCLALVGVMFGTLHAAEVVVSGKTGHDIQSAIDQVAAQGGGRVVLPAGEWTTGTIEIRSNVELHLSKGAVLKGSLNQADYNKDDVFPENFKSEAEEWSGAHLIMGYKVENVAITGEGVIDGNGPTFFGDCDEDSRWPWYKYGLKLHPLDRTWFRPGPLLAFFLSKNIRIEGVKIINPPAWTCHVRCSDGFTARGVTIDADRTIANSDGFSIDCTRNALIEKCVLRTGDDGIAIRASCKHHAETNFCENIRVDDCDIWSCCYGIRIGIGSGTIQNVIISNTRIHEASVAGVGFTPAWVNSARNCYIQDVTVTNCTISECVRPVEGALQGNSRIDDICFIDCTFNTLLPVQVSDACSFSFVRCVRNTIPRFKVRHRRGFAEREIRAKRSVFLEGGARGKITVEDCRPLPPGSTGVLLLAFDDRNFADWERAIPLFEKYGAHASFFVSGDFDSEAVRVAKKLMAEGHTMGMHGRTHMNVPQAFETLGKEGWWEKEITTPRRQADVAYVPVHAFAYPNNRNDAETDEFLLTRFERLRTGVSDVRPYDPENKFVKDLKPLATDDRLFFPASELSRHRVIGGVILGDAYNVDIEDVLACVRRAGERKEVVLFTSHGIHPNAGGIHLKTEWLESILAEAKKSGVQVLGFDELW
ncbi:MAG: glycosyl hydrolase family 28 protein [Planctomycetia bacterium]|nr:glycosyl hydrolase family 28 protein [Planctomycetia bacterium]